MKYHYKDLWKWAKLPNIMEQKKGLTKRDFLKLGGLGAISSLALSNPSAASSDMKKSNIDSNKKIDVHAHFHTPDFFREIERRFGKSEQMPGWKLLGMKKDTYMQTYSIEERLDWMSKFGIEKSVFSFPTINLYVNEITAPQKRIEMSKFINDIFAKTHHKYPNRALFFADVPLGTDPDFSRKELVRAITQLGLHGVAIQTNNAGRLPHERDFDDFFSEAERLDVPVFMHPCISPWFKHAYSGLDKYLVYALVGFPADASIAVAYMILDGFFERHKNSKIILTHLGSTAPYIYYRLGETLENQYLPPTISGKSNLTKMPLEYLKMFYYDTASGNPEALQLCESILDENKILLGTDHPYIESAERIAIDYLKRTKITKNQLEKIYFKNGRDLFKLKV